METARNKSSNYIHDFLWLHLHLSSASHFMCNICNLFLPLVGLPFIRPSIISSSKLSCLKICPIQRCCLCWVFIICLFSSTFACTSSFEVRQWHSKRCMWWEFLFVVQLERKKWKLRRQLLQKQKKLNEFVNDCHWWYCSSAHSWFDLFAKSISVHSF